jgi:hypothetical protein
MAAAAWIVPLAARAHGIGGRQDLPVPLEFFVVGASLVLVLSFAALAVLWTEPRLQVLPAPRSVGHISAWLDRVLAGLGVAGLIVVVVAGFIGEDSTRNPAPPLVFVAFWLIVPFASAVLGDLYPSLDPWRWLRAAFGSTDAGRPEGSTLPAAFAFLAFTWLELISPAQTPRHLAIAAIVYSIYLVLATWSGRRAADVDGFAVYNRLLGAISPWTRDQEGRRVRYGWLRGLPQLPARTDLVVFVVVMIGTVTYDGASVTDWWAGAVELPTSRLFFDLGLPSTAASAVGQTLPFLGVSVAIGAAYYLASWAAARLGGVGSATTVASRFAHTLVPIALAYAFSHYFTLILFEGQLLISSMSDPFGLGWNLFGAVDRPVDFSLIQGPAGATWIWYVQVAAIVAGHVAGVILAHDRALADFEGIRAVRSQYAMLLLMVGLTGLGLVILAAG